MFLKYDVLLLRTQKINIFVNALHSLHYLKVFRVEHLSCLKITTGDLNFKGGLNTLSFHNTHTAQVCAKFVFCDVSERIDQILTAGVTQIQISVAFYWVNSFFFFFYN